jgi:fatty acid desaturase
MAATVRRRSGDASTAYVELRQAIVGAGLLERAHGYYLARGTLCFAMLGASIALAALAPGGIVWGIVGALAIAFSSVQVALIGHDAGHLAVARRRWANWALGSVCWSLVLGIGFWYWNDRHNRHHAETNDIDADPDLQWAGLVRYTESAVRDRPPRLRWLARHQAVIGPILTLALPFAFRVEGWLFALRNLRGKRQYLEIGLLVLSVVGWTLPAVVLGWGWLGIFVLAQALAGLYLALAIAPNHKGMPIWPAGTELSFLERQVLSSRNITPGPLADFVLGGLNYQIEHHLFPTMPRVHFGRARAIVQPFCQAYGLPYDEMGALASYALVLSELRRVGKAAG